MNEIVNKFLLAGDKCMPEMHLKELGFTYTACGPITKILRIQNFKETGDTDYRTASDKVLKDKAFNIAKDSKYDGYQSLAAIVYKFFDKSAGSGVNTHANNEKIAEHLQTPIIKKFKKATVYSEFKGNICGANLAGMQLISKFNKGFRFLLCVIDIFSKYAWVVPLKDKKGVSIVNMFERSEINQSEFYNSSLKKIVKT